MSLLYIACPDRGCQSIGVLVGQSHHLIDIIEHQCCQHRPEDLFLRNLHVILDLAEDGRLKEESLAAIDRYAISTGNQPGPFLLARLDVAEHSVELLLADNGPHAGFGIKGIGWLHLLSPPNPLDPKTRMGAIVSQE